METERPTPRTEAWARKAELQDAIIEAVRSMDGVGGIKAFQAYDDFIAAQARTEALDVEALRETLAANMFDGGEGGVVTMSVKVLLDDVVEIVSEFLAAKETPDDDWDPRVSERYR